MMHPAMAAMTKRRTKRRKKGRGLHAFISLVSCRLMLGFVYDKRRRGGIGVGLAAQDMTKEQGQREREEKEKPPASYFDEGIYYEGGRSSRLHQDCSLDYTLRPVKM